MKEPIWLESGDCLAFHGELLARFGGLGGLREPGLLESALRSPRQLFNYGKPTLHEMAAAYAFGIVKNHPFVDGNKRAGFLAAALFLEANGESFVAAEEEVAIMTKALAAGEVPEKGYAAWLKDSCAPKPRRKAKR